MVWEGFFPPNWFIIKRQDTKWTLSRRKRNQFLKFAWGSQYIRRHVDFMRHHLIIYSSIPRRIYCSILQYFTYILTAKLRGKTYYSCVEFSVYIRRLQKMYYHHRIFHVTNFYSHYKWYIHVYLYFLSGKYIQTEDGGIRRLTRKLQ